MPAPNAPRFPCNTRSSWLAAPTHFIHSPSEMISIADLKGAVDLIAEFVKDDPETDVAEGSVSDND